MSNGTINEDAASTIPQRLWVGGERSRPAQTRFPRILDLVMRQKQMVPFRERIGKTAEARVLDGQE